MKQGASRHPLADRKDDLYETPACAVEALLRHWPELQLRPVWEPCAGRGAIKRVLENYGMRIIASDLVVHDGADEGIETGLDFLFERVRRADTIITNPPYKLQDRFIRHGLALGCEVVVLLRLMAIEGMGRSDLNDVYLDEVAAGKERLPMMHRDGWMGEKVQSSGVPFAWFRYQPWKRENEFIKLSRLSWRGAV